MGALTGTVQQEWLVYASKYCTFPLNVNLEETVMAPSPVREPCLHQGYYAAEALANSVPIP